MTERADVLVVGGRCAGAPLATWLARAGVRVVLADCATFPSDTLSTHVFQSGAIASLRRLGALERVLATGAPPVARGRVRFATAGDVLEARGAHAGARPGPASDAVRAPRRPRRDPARRRGGGGGDHPRWLLCARARA
ncbi:MAG TPA: FAD-dependent monooxygenase [Solirubrobacteraceae bacterium]|nr:FAD-dependent monooxygenase [Solirubrobacteraceae bacterium]